MEQTNTQAPTLSQHHFDFLSALSQLTNVIAPIVSGLVPGAAPVVLGVEAIEKVAADLLSTIDNVKAAAQNIPTAQAIAQADTAAEQPLAPVIDISTGAESSTETQDAAALAAESISKSEKPVPERLLQLETEFNALIADIKPFIDMARLEWPKLANVFRQLGL